MNEFKERLPLQVCCNTLVWTKERFFAISEETKDNDDEYI